MICPKCATGNGPQARKRDSQVATGHGDRRIRSQLAGGGHGSVAATLNGHIGRDTVTRQLGLAQKIGAAMIGPFAIVSLFR